MIEAEMNRPVSFGERHSVCVPRDPRDPKDQIDTDSLSLTTLNHRCGAIDPLRTRPHRCPLTPPPVQIHLTGLVQHRAARRASATCQPFQCWGSYLSARARAVIAKKAGTVRSGTSAVTAAKPQTLRRPKGQMANTHLGPQRHNTNRKPMPPTRSHGG